MVFNTEIMPGFKVGPTHFKAVEDAFNQSYGELVDNFASTFNVDEVHISKLHRTDKAHFVYEYLILNALGGTIIGAMNIIGLNQEFAVLDWYYPTAECCDLFGLPLEPKWDYPICEWIIENHNCEVTVTFKPDTDGSTVAVIALYGVNDRADRRPELMDFLRQVMPVEFFEVLHDGKFDDNPDDAVGFILKPLFVEEV